MQTHDYPRIDGLRLCLSSLAMTGAVLLASSAAAGGVKPPDYDFDWAVIGDPANEPYPGGLGGVNAGRGSVVHAYRIARTEVAGAQWLEFLNAYAPFVEDVQSPVSPHLTGSFIVMRRDPSTGLPTYELSDERFGGYPVNMSWHNAARYCNWLHNEKALTRDAFEGGAYDASTFVRAPGEKGRPGPWLSQAERSPGARFFIPDLDEWLKAVYYDPDRFGPSGPGYWMYPNSSDTPPVIGPPGTGGETNAGLGFEYPLDVGQYPQTTSPWGLLDASGGLSEYLEDWDDPTTPFLRRAAGSGLFSLLILGDS